jgi:autotransporter-associated beta strand protein
VNAPFRTYIYCRLFLLLAIAGLSVPAAFASYQTITNDAFYLTTAGTGTPIYAQGGGISKFGNTYYWYGVQYSGMSTYYKSPTSANASANTGFVAINCYSSTDMAHWTYQGAIINKSTTGFKSTGWIGRMGQVVYNSTTNQYVTWFQYTSGTNTGQACCTGTSPSGSFVLNNVQTAITNVYYNVTGDCTIFCDTDHGGTPYLVFSDSHGREHLYVSSLTSNYLSINPATLITEWPQGQEANNMFGRNGLYYACMSNLAGWSYSSAYEVSSPNIQTPSSYSADATFAGTDLSDTYYSQISFVVPVAGNQTTSYILVGDRWSQNDSSYLSAGHGLGFNIMGPVTFNGTTPTFVPVASFQIDAVTGNWRQTPAFAAPTGLTATPGNAQVALSWDASGSATTYTIQSAAAPGGPYTIIASGLTSTTYTDTTAANGSTYYYEVAAVNASGTTTYTLPVSAIPSTNPAPAAPGELAETTGTSQVSLSWDASVSATSYIVQRATSSAGPYTTIATGTSTVYTDTKVTYGPTYYYEIAATNATATSTNSPPVSANLTGNITWTGSSGGTWDTSTANWLFGASTPALYEDGDTVVFPNAATTTSINIASQVSPAFTTFSNSSTSYTIAGAGISGTGGITINSAGSVTLSSSNTYLGPTTLASGATLVVANTNSLQNSTLNFTTGSLTMSTAITAATFGGLQGTSTAQNLVLASTSGPVALTVGGNGTPATTYSGSISGAGSLTKSGTGALTLSNATYTGATIVNAGTLTIVGNIGSTSPSAAIYLYGGTLNINGATVHAPSLENENLSTLNLTGNGSISISGALSANGSNTDSPGVISLVSGSLTAGSAIIGRDSANDSTTLPTAGSTTDGIYVDGATVNITNTLGIGTNGANSTAQMREDAGSVTVGGVTTVTNNASSRYSVLDLNGGTFTDNDSTGVGILVGGNANAGLLSELLIRGAALVNIPAITVGNTSDNGGTLNLTIIGGTTYIGSGGIVSTAPSPTLVVIALGSSSSTVAPIIGASAPWSSSLPMTLTNSSASAPVTFKTASASGTPENITLSGTLSGAGGLTQTGAGTLTLSGDNTYSGATDILSGVLQLTGSLSTTSSLTIANGATFYLAGGLLSVSGGITNNGTFKISGAPSLAETGSFINNGVLDLINGPQSLPANFVNNGTVLNSNAVQVQQLGMSGSNFALSILGIAHHTYQLQRASSLAAPITWANVGTPQSGAGTLLTFTDPSPAPGQAFYQVQVSP